MIETPRLRLRHWRDSDREAFAALHADPAVMRDQGGPIDRHASDAKLHRYRSAFQQWDFGRWAIETHDEAFLGYAGVMPGPDDHPLGPHFEIGWRLMRTAWGSGFASEAARAALRDAFDRGGMAEILAYTAEDNHRSRAVMKRLCLRRDPSRDFITYYEDTGDWHGLVWAAAGADIIAPEPAPRPVR